MGHDDPQNSGVGDWHTQQTSYAFRAATAYEQSELSDEMGDPHGFAGTGLQVRRKALSKNALWAAGIRTT